MTDCTEEGRIREQLLALQNSQNPEDFNRIVELTKALDSLNEEYSQQMQLCIALSLYDNEALHADPVPSAPPIEPPELLTQSSLPVHSDLNPYDVMCPFCGRILEAPAFRRHALADHADKADEYHHCGICMLKTTAALEKVPLIEHLRDEHKEFDEVDPNDGQLERRVGYNEYVQQKDDPRECMLDYCSFHAGDSVIIFSCMCMFHKSCIMQWWARDEKNQGKCPLHDRDSLM